jgi:hypothetical protein
MNSSLSALDDGALGWESFDEATGPTVARVGQLLKRVGRLRRIGRLGQDLNTFDLMRLVRDERALVRELAEELDKLEGILSRVQMVAGSDDEKNWAREFEESLRDLRVEFSGSYPTYLVFPLEIRVDLAQDTATINDRITHTLRPKSLAKAVQAERERLFSARFKERQFMRAMAEVYDLLTKADGGLAVGVELRRAYEMLSLREGTSSYPLRQFAFDLYRLRYHSDMVYQGRRFVLNPSKSARRAIQVPRPNGGIENLGSYELVVENR